MTTHRLTKRQRRVLRQDGVGDLFNEVSKGKFNLIDVERRWPLTETQRNVIAAYNEGQHLVLHGVAGTGKTFLSMYLALNEVLTTEDVDKVYIIRSVVPTRDMGFLPGNARQKAAVYEAPYSAIATELFGRGDAYDILKNKNNVEFLSTSFIRGTTFRNCIIIADEINNMTFHELDSLITRVGNNCRIIFCGDYRQTDLITTADRNGLQRFMNVLNTIKSFTHIEFGISDIVRSGIVKEYIISKSDLGYV
jgi:phosphate starvation-inducible PhoH-like protein